MPEAAEVFLVRHGETAWSISGQHTGRADIPLTDRGREQARCAGEALRGVDFGLALTSPSSRATETAVLAGAGGTLQPSDDLREWHYGVYEGLTTKELRELGALAAAAGVTETGNDTEVAVRISRRRVTAFAEGRGACHAVAALGR